MESLWSGQVYFRGTSTCYIGSPGNLPFHGSYPIRVIIGIENPLQAQFAGHPIPILAPAIAISGNVPHQLVGEHPDRMALWLDPASDEGRFVTRNVLRHRAYQLLPTSLANELRRLSRTALHLPQSVEFGSLLLLTALHEMGFDERRRQRLDRRLEEARHAILADPSQPWSIEDLARQSRLSPRHFRHLFSMETGSSFKRFIQWARIIHATKSFGPEIPLSTAAANGGFADLSHYTRTFRQLVGVPPSQVAHQLTCHS